MSLLHLKIVNRLIGTMMLSLALSACTTPPTPVEQRGVPTADISGKMQTLQKQIQERDKRIEEQDKRIEELESQLDALRLIDQDRENQRKPPRPPTTLERQ